MSSAATLSKPAQAIPPGGEKLVLELLCGVLQKEHDALMTRDADLVASLASEKQALLDQLAVFVRARTSRAPRQALQQARNMDPQLRALWKKVSSMNGTNSAVLALHAGVVNRALGVMRHAVGRVDGPYTAQGRLTGHYLTAL
jgi:flagellar biosynthesis/type III secretory pathway chaperone